MTDAHDGARLVTPAVRDAENAVHPNPVGLPAISEAVIRLARHPRRSAL
jgi:hypothetical protein